MDLPVKLEWSELQGAGYPELRANPTLDDDVSKEYFHLQSIVDGYNSDCLTIKSWSVTVSAVALGAAITEKLPSLALVAVVTSLSFWLSEAYWRANQWAFIQRIREIELRRYAYSPLISYGWAKHFQGWLGRNGFWQVRSAVPHVLIMAAALCWWMKA
jgi:hypothetical protein